MVNKRLYLYSLDLYQKTTIIKWLDFLEKSQWWTNSEIEVYQNEKLKALISHCYLNVQFYNETFKVLKLKPDDFKSIQDLYKIPPLTKQIVKQNFNKFLSSNFHLYKPVYKRTGGSTGVPFFYYNDTNVRSLQWALKFRSWNWGGYNLGDKIAIMGGGSLFPSEKKSIKRILWKKINNFYPMPMTHFTTDMVFEYANIISKKNIKFLRGYPSSISIFAKILMAENIFLKVDSIFPTAEVLTEAYRNDINRGLTFNIFDQYGCADAGAHASECEMHNGLHVHPEVVVTELLDEKNNKVKNGEKGELAFTSLHNYSMPLLRYKPEDIALQSNRNCKCGRKSILLEKIIGRTTDIIKFGNGHVIGGPALTLIFSRVNVEKYQVIQNELNKLEVSIIITSAFTKAEYNKLYSSLQMHCGQDVIIKINIVNEIPLPESGKFRFIISNINEKL